MLFVDEEEDRRYILVQEAQERHQIVHHSVGPSLSRSKAPFIKKSIKTHVCIEVKPRTPRYTTPKMPYRLPVITASERFQIRVPQKIVDRTTSQPSRIPKHKVCEGTKLCTGDIVASPNSLTSSRTLTDETKINDSDGPTLPTDPRTDWVTSVLAHWRPQLPQLGAKPPASQRTSIRLRLLLDDHEMSPHSLWDRKHFSTDQPIDVEGRPS